MVDGFQNAALSTRLGIPIIYGIDAVHGHNNVYGATIFPHNIGLGATRWVIIIYRETIWNNWGSKEKKLNDVHLGIPLDCCLIIVSILRDPELVQRIGAATALEVRATGIPYAFAPCIAVSEFLDFEDLYITRQGGAGWCFLTKYHGWWFLNRLLGIQGGADAMRVTVKILNLSNKWRRLFLAFKEHPLKGIPKDCLMLEEGMNPNIPYR